MRKRSIAIFASGRGSNALKIIQHFKDHENISVELIVSNRKDAGIFDVAKENKIAAVYIPKSKFSEERYVLGVLDSYKIEFISLAGFLLLIPEFLIKYFNGKIINIHPALLPKYGGKGMYGHHVHEAVSMAKDKVSGMSIHLVNEEFDKGQILFQAKCILDEGDVALDIAQKVLSLEHKYYPLILEQYIQGFE